ncbi:PD-(D/E)XK nuclease family protein [Xanthobacter autotrophicus]|uniref:PD-(D/E)XK nuclease family protein n=1 Tax=Xanthobacter autotrophicus TaxID=280 RepID=UPI00372C8495
MNYTRHSPSALNLFAACPSMFVLERVVGRRQPVGAAAHRGTAVEAGVAHGLDNPDASVEECTALAETRFRELAALCGDSRRDKVEAGIPDMVARALAELRPYGPPSGKQGFIEWRPEGLTYPIVGYYDFAWDEHGIIVDLKTTERLPSEVKAPHARQVALYTGGNMEGRLAYVTPAKSTVYRLENVPAHRDALHRMALACERFLALSDDPQFFVSITSPDLDAFYFATPGARQAAWETWGV